MNKFLNFYPAWRDEHLMGEDVEDAVAENITGWLNGIGLYGLAADFITNWFSDTYFDPDSTNPMSAGFIFVFIQVELIKSEKKKKILVGY